MPTIRFTLSLIWARTIVLEFGSRLFTAVLKIVMAERIASGKQRNLRRLGVVIVAIAVSVVSCATNVTRSFFRTMEPIATTATEVKDPRVVLPVCNCEEYISFDESIVVRLRWGAKTRDLAEQGADFVVYTATVDDVVIEGLDECRKPAVFEPKSADDEDAWWVYWDYPLGTLPAGDHTVVAVFVASATISDGWWTFPKGESATLKVTLHVSGPSPVEHTYLSELQPESVAVGWGAFSIGNYEFTSTNQTHRIMKGDPIVVHKVEYHHGLYAHAPSRLTYNLHRDFSQLETTIGLVDWIDCGDGAQFIIVLDDKEIYRSPIMIASSAPIDVKVGVAGGSKLELIVNDGVTKECDWAIWGDPRLR